MFVSIMKKRFLTFVLLFISACLFALDSVSSDAQLYNEVKQTVDLNRVVVFIVGNKNDMYMHEKIKKEEAEQYTKSINGIYR